MATKSSVAIPNGTLYNYNPFTNIMPLNESWVYYKYTTTGVDLTHDISQDLSRLNSNADIFVLYAGGGGYGGQAIQPNLQNFINNLSYTEETITDVKFINGGGGGTGEINLTKINLSTIKDKKIYFNIGSTNKNTSFTYTNSTTNVSQSFMAYGNTNKIITTVFDGLNLEINGSDGAVYNKIDRPINQQSFINNILYCGSASGYIGRIDLYNMYYSPTYQDPYGYTSYYLERYGDYVNSIFGNYANLTICDDYNGSNAVINNPSYLRNISLTDINNGKKYLGCKNVVEAKINFSNLQITSDNTGAGTVLSGGYGGNSYINWRSLVDEYGINYYEKQIIASNGANGPDGFVMVFYKLSIGMKQITNDYGGIQTNYNPLNYLFFPKNNYNYFKYNKNIITSTGIFHTIVNDGTSNNSIIPDSNGNKVVNILYVGNGALGGSGNTTIGGGGGGSGGEVLITKITIDLINNNSIKISTNSSNQIVISNIYTYSSTNTKTPTTILGNASVKGQNAYLNSNKRACAGYGANGLDIRTMPYTNSTGTSFNKTTSYGSGNGGGGIAILNGNDGYPGSTSSSFQISVNSSRTSPSYISTNIGDETGLVNVSSGGYGGNVGCSGSAGDDGFVLIYYLVKGQM